MTTSRTPTGRWTGFEIGLSYKANYDQAKDELISEEMAIQGKQMEMSKGRIFVIDMTVNPVHCQQVNPKLPSSDDIDFLSGSVDRYESFTERWITELAKESDVISKTFFP